MHLYGKRICALLLALCLLVGILPVSALAENESAGAQVVGQQLFLGDDLTMHFYVSVDATDAVVNIKVGGTQRVSYTVADMTATDGKYDCAVELGAPEMTEEITLSVVSGGEQLLESVYSVQDYAHYLLENNYTNETKALVKEMLNYGAKAQLYFNHKTDDLADAGYEIETQATIAQEAPAVEASGKVSGVAFYGASLLFGNKIAVRYYFSAPNGVEGCTFTVDGKTMEPKSKDNLFYIDVTDVNPDQMETEMTVVASKDAEELTVVYSPMHYIVRMYNKETVSAEMKALLLAAKGYFDAAAVFTGVAENRTGSLSLQYRYGTNNLIQVNTNLPADTPCVNFTAADNGSSIDQSANQYQQFGWVGMENVDGTIVLTFHFNSAFEAGQTYTLPKGAVFGFTDNSKYTLDKNYTFTYDGSGWAMEAAEPAISLQYRYGTESLIQFNTDLPADVPCVNFTAGDNGCSLDQSANQYQQVGWIGMENVDGTIVLTFHFNGAFAEGQNYILSAGSLFGFTDGSKYQLDAEVNLYWDGSAWSAEAPPVVTEPPATEPPVTEPPATEAPEDGQISFAYRYGTNNLIQVNTNLPSDTPCVNFTATDNGCSIDQSGNTVQWVGWIGMANADGTIVLSFNFNNAFTAGQTYVLPASAIFGFTDGSVYELDKSYTFTFDGSGWSMAAEAPAEPEPEVTEPPATEAPEEGQISFAYRYGADNLIQVNTNLPSDTPCVNFTATENGCSIDQSANQYQQFGWVGMDNVGGTIVLTFHFNAAFEAGQTYVLPAGAIFGFTDGSLYELDKNYTFTFDGSSWSMAAEVPAEPETKPISLAYRYGAEKLIQFNTNLPSDTPCVNFLAGENGCQITQNGDQQVGFIAMADAEGTIVLTFNFNAAFTYGQKYTLAAGSVFAFTDGSSYVLDADYTFYWDGTAWTTEEPAKQIHLTYRWGNANTIQYNTDLPSDTPCANFLTGDNGCQITQSGDQQVGWIGMENVDGTIVLTFHFNAAFTYGQSYSISAGSVFGFTDGSSYTLPEEVKLYWDGAAWSVNEPAKRIHLTYRWGNANTIQYNTDLPSDTPCANFLAGDNGCQITQNGDQQVGWIGMENVDGTVVLTFHFNAAFAYGQSYSISAGSVFGFTDGSSYTLPEEVKLYWDEASWTDTEPAPKADVLDENNFTGGKDIITFADLPVDSKDPAKIEEYKGLGFNTSLLTEDHTGAKGPDELYTVTMDTANAPTGLNFQYRYGTSTLIQVNTNLPSDTPIANFTADQNGCSIDQSGNTVQWVGWIGMADADGTIVLTFNFNNAFTAGQSYVLPKGAVFGFTDGNTYTLDRDYTFTFDGSSWSMNASTLNLTLSAGAAKYIQLKTNIPTGLSYGDFLMGDTSKGNLILETTEGAQSVAWFSYSELSGAVYLTFNFTGYHKPGTQYILKAGTSLKAGDYVFTTDRDYILTVHNDYLGSLENLDNAGLNVWIRNYHNTADYFSGDLTATLLLYKDVIDGFYMVDEAFQTNALLTTAGQESHSSDFESMTVVRDWFNTNFADKYYHSNHVPLSSWDHYTAVDGSTLSAIDVDGYRNFLQVYKSNYNDLLTNASGTSISFDNYPFVHDQGEYGGFFGIGSTFESGIQDTYLLNSLIAAQVAGEDDFGLCIQTFEATDLKNNTTRDITSAAEVSLQLYTGMAMGADLFEYFAYNSNDDFNAIMNNDGSKRLYDLVKEGNEALCFSDVINTFTWNGIMTSAGSVNNHNGDAFTSVADLVLTDSSNGVLSSISSTDDAIVGCFTKDALNGYMLVNFNDPAAVTGNNAVTVSFANCTRARVYTNADGVLTSQLVDLTDGSYTATLAPGAACFVIPA